MVDLDSKHQFIALVQTKRIRKLKRKIVWGHPSTRVYCAVKYFMQWQLRAHRASWPFLCSNIQSSLMQLQVSFSLGSFVSDKHVWNFTSVLFLVWELFGYKLIMVEILAIANLWRNQMRSQQAKGKIWNGNRYLLMWNVDLLTKYLRIWEVALFLLHI